MSNATKNARKLRRWIDLVEFAGADPTGTADSSPAMQAAMDYAAITGASIRVPTGDFRLSNKVVKSAIGRNISIIGDGQDLSRFIVDSAAGGIELSFNSVERLCKVQGVAFVAAIPGAGKALRVDFPSSPTSWTRRCLTLRDIDIYPEDNLTDYFTHGVHVSSAWHGALDNLLIRGNLNQRLMTAAVLIDGNSIDLSIRALRTYFGVYGVKVEGASEGIRVLDTSIVWFTRGIDVNSSAAGDPELQVHDGHIRTFEYGIYAEKRSQVKISGILFYKEDSSTANYWDVYLKDCLGCDVHDNLCTIAGSGGTSKFYYATGQGAHNVHHNDIQLRDIGIEWASDCTNSEESHNIFSTVTTPVIDAALNNRPDRSDITSAKTADYTVTFGDRLTRFTNNGAGGTITFALPDARAGKEYSFHRISPQTVRIDPNGTDVIRGGGAGKYLSLDTNGANVTLRCVVTNTWEILSSYGTLSYEP
jgi:hypothetical protein